MKDAQIMTKITMKNGEASIPDFGFEFKNDKIKSKTWISAEKSPKLDM